MSLRSITCGFVRTSVFLGCASLASAGVHIVDATGQGSFTTIQAAVDAAIEGDVILVRSGSYAAFTIDNKGLAIYADAAAIVQVTGNVQVLNVAAAKAVVISGLQVVGTSTTPAPTVALTLTNNSGALRFQKCTLRGGNGLHVGSDTQPPAAHGARLTNNPNVSFVGCTIQGGDAYSDDENCYECSGGAGGDGVLAQTSAVALYDSLCTGGQGGEAGSQGGAGGTGYHALDWGGFASRTAFKGGRGGDAWDFVVAFGGNGGHGLWVDSNAGFHLLSDTFQPGAGGISYIFPSWNGVPGDAIHGTGVVDALPGTARVVVANTLAETGGSIDVTVYGQPGDEVFVPTSLRTSFSYKAALSGVSLIHHPVHLPVDPYGVVPASGVLALQVPVLDLPSGFDAAVSFMQALIVDTDGDHILGSPIDALLLRCASLAPDCNANGRMDTCDLFQLVSVDCDVNGFPDECQPDCNGNGIVDACDISSHASQDANHNGVPDECESAVATWYVDASAAPGGNGSFANPFQTISQGIAISLSSHTVIVRDGVYTGAANRNLDFTGRDIVVRSQNGPASCILDCQQAGRAFSLRSGETAAARVEGFTIVNGKPAIGTFQPQYGGAMHIWTSSPTVRNCVFTNCVAPTDGGAMYTFDSDSLIRDCTFTANQTLNQGNAAGGALECVHHSPRIVNCFFSGNVAPRYGGALAFFSTQSPVVSNCAILGNRAVQFSGGALYMTGLGGNGATFVNCLVAGNSATNGGAFAGNAVLKLSNVTIVGNSATARGGGIERSQGGTGNIGNSIVWGNTAPTGAQIALSGNSGSIAVYASDVQGGQAGVFVDSGPTLIWDSNNLALDPSFANPNGPDGNPATFSDNDYRLSLGSPCIDAASNGIVLADLGDIDGDNDTGELLPLDLDQLPRIRDIPSAPDTGTGTAPIVDMGAYERQP